MRMEEMIIAVVSAAVGSAVGKAIELVAKAIAARKAPERRGKHARRP